MIIPTVAEPGQVPTYAHVGDAGADLRASHDVTLRPGERARVGTGVRIALADGLVGLVTPRSGLAARHGLSVVNSPGIIDSGYRGEIKVSLINLDPAESLTLHAGDRIAQLVVIPFISATFTPVDTLDETARGADGYGSTGGFTTSTPSKD